MGKSKKKKNRHRLENPTGLPSVKEMEMEADIASEGASTELSTVPLATITTLLERLQNSQVEERECGCMMAAGLAAQSGTVHKLLQSDLVKVMGPLLMDSSVSVRQAALGAFRNITVDGGLDACDTMVQQDIMTPLVTLLHQYGSGWTPTKSDKPGVSTEQGIFLQAVHLLWNLCESNETAVKIFNRQKLLMVLLPCIQINVYGIDVAIAVAQCLHTVTENNPEAVSALSNDEFISIMQSTVQQQHTGRQQMLFRMLAAGILYNITNGNLPSAAGSVVTKIVIFLSEVLSCDVNSDICRISQKLANSNGYSEAANAEPKESYEDNGKSILQPEIDKTRELLSTQQLALELAANLCTSQDEDVWEDLDSSDGSEEVDIDMADNQNVDDADNPMEPLCLPSEVNTAFIEEKIPEKVLGKMTIPDEEILLILSKHNDARIIIKSLAGVQRRALLCISNLLSLLPVDSVGGLQGLSYLWDKLSVMANNKSNLADNDLLEAVTSAMRASIQLLAKHNSPKFQDVTPADLGFLVELGLHQQHPQIRVNAARIAATIGCMLAKPPHTHIAVKDIGMFLLEICVKDTELWVIAEALDCIFDLFGEDHLDTVCQEIGLVNKLKAIVPVLKAKVSQQRVHLGEHLPIIHTARTNLSRFIKYKSKP